MDINKYFFLSGDTMVKTSKKYNLSELNIEKLSRPTAKKKTV